MAQAEGMLGCDRSWLEGVVAERGLLEALSARLPDNLEPIAGWRRTGALSLPDGEFRWQKWWSSRLTQCQAADLAEKAAGRDIPRLEVQKAGMGDEWMSPPPQVGSGLCMGGRQYATMVKWHLGECLLPADCAGRPCGVCGEAVDVFGDHAVTCAKSGFGARHLGVQAFFSQILTQAQTPHKREVDIPGDGKRPADILLAQWDGQRDLAVDLTISRPNPVGSPPARGSAAKVMTEKVV